MKGIRRFQRTLFTLLLGVNVFVFSYSFYKEMGLSLWYSASAMIIAATLLISVSYIKKTLIAKKKLPLSQSSKQN
jgi:hypothetical protein